MLKSTPPLRLFGKEGPQQLLYDAYVYGIAYGGSNQQIAAAPQPPIRSTVPRKFGAHMASHTKKGTHPGAHIKKMCALAACVIAILCGMNTTAAQVYPVLGQPCCPSDIRSAFIPQQEDAQRIQSWVGRILAYRVRDERDPLGIPQRTEIDFQQDGDSTRYTIYLGYPSEVKRKGLAMQCAYDYQYV